MCTSKPMFPTPTCCGLDGGSNSRRAAKRRGTYIGGGGANTSFPTACAHGLSGGAGAVDKIRSLHESGMISEEEMLSMQSGNGGKLNPDWVEWLMGWTVGWSNIDVGNDELFALPISEDPADSGCMRRLTDDRTNRISRIKALGNGQVPLCAAVAFEWGIQELDSLAR